MDQGEHIGEGRIAAACGGEIENFLLLGIDDADALFAAGFEGCELHDQFSRIATARVQPAEAALIFTGKQAMRKPCAGSCSRLCSFSRWQ